MFGNRAATALSILQKTYDESYLTCSTAVYYESQVRTQHLPICLTATGHCS